MNKKDLIKHIEEKYNKDKIWCINYHNEGHVELYNMIFGRLQSLVMIDNEFNLGLNLLDDMQKNIPWNKKLLAGYRNTKIEFVTFDVDNLNEKN